MEKLVWFKLLTHDLLLFSSYFQESEFQDTSLKKKPAVSPILVIVSSNAVGHSFFIQIDSTAIDLKVNIIS
jgi:hypothetical protein